MEKHSSGVRDLSSLASVGQAPDHCLVMWEGCEGGRRDKGRTPTLGLGLPASPSNRAGFGHLTKVRRDTIYPAKTVHHRLWAKTLGYFQRENNIFFPFHSLRRLSEEARPLEHFLSWLRGCGRSFPRTDGQGKAQNPNSCRWDCETGENHEVQIHLSSFTSLSRVLEWSQLSQAKSYLL